MQKIQLFGAKIDVVTLQEAARYLHQCAEEPPERCRYVVTPNVDHLVMFQENPALRDAYADAELVVADGAPVVLASRLLRRALPCRVSGSDLAPAVLDLATKESPMTLFLLGAGPGVADQAAARIESTWPAIKVVGTYCPPLGFEKDEAENERILAAINSVKPDILFIGLGAPKQELWIHQHQDRVEANIALCIGAAIDFLAGHKARAPLWMRSIGLEWLHRLATEPRRLFRRYAHDAWVFPQLFWKEWRSGN